MDRFQSLRTGFPATLVNSFVHGHIMNVDTAPILLAHSLTVNSMTLIGGVQIQADPNNGSNLFIGGESVSVVGSYQGLVLDAGVGFFFPVANLNLAYIIADATSQAVTYIAW